MVTLSSFMLTLVGLVGKLSLEVLAVEASDVADAYTCAWNTAALEGLLPPSFRNGHWNLAQISEYLTEGAGSPIAYHPDAVEIARATIRRAAKIAAILCAGPLLRISGHQHPLRVAMEGSQYWKLTGFRDAFHRELDALLRPWGIAYEIIKTENACLIGAARAAFAKKM